MGNFRGYPTVHKPSYFLISVSTRHNLELCIRHGLAGFLSGASGAWTFCEIQEGDFVSFLYGARAHNLYEVTKRTAFTDADKLPPWPLLTFKESGKTYSFPFRLDLNPLRLFSESLVRAEFSYVAENLLLRGGYRRTHFQTDQTTLQSVSQMGELCDKPVQPLVMPPHETFSLLFSRNTKLLTPPMICQFQELILQSAIRRHLLANGNLDNLLQSIGVTAVSADSLEILGEKALMQGHVDLLLKQRVPIGSTTRIPIEVKLGTGTADDVEQTRNYMRELSGECPSGILIAAKFTKKAIVKAQELGVKLVSYSIGADLQGTASFDEIWNSLTLAKV